MFIRGSYNFMFAHRQAGLHQSTMLRALQRLSSGYRINSARDDPAGLAMSERMRAQITATNQAVENAKNGLGMVDVAEGSLNSVSRSLQRLVDLSTQAASGTLTDEQRANLSAEAQQLLEGLRATAGSSKYAGQQLLDSAKEVSLQVGDSDNDYDKLLVQMPDLEAALGMLDGFSLDTQQQALESLQKVYGAVDKVSELRAGMGAQSNRLEHTISYLENYAENLTEAESRIRDADMAKELMTFVRASALNEVANIMMVHAMDEPKRVLKLLETGL